MRPEGRFERSLDLQAERNPNPGRYTMTEEERAADLAHWHKVLLEHAAGYTGIDWLEEQRKQRDYDDQQQCAVLAGAGML